MIRNMNSYPLYDDGEHKVYWLGIEESEEEHREQEVEKTEAAEREGLQTPHQPPGLDGLHVPTASKNRNKWSVQSFFPLFA